jgi:drug/metabolite transporter (DMT)-like permease
MNQPAPKPSFVSGLLPVMFGASMISFSAVFVKLAHVGPTMAGFYRVFFGGALLVAMVLIQRKRLWHGPRPFALAVAAGVFFALDLSFWHRSIHILGPGLSTILSNFQVFFMAGMGALLLGERLGPRLILGIPLAMAGLYLLVGLNFASLGEDYQRGVIFGLLTALCYGCYILTLRQLQSRADAPGRTASLTVVSLVTALVMGLEGWFQGESFVIPDAQSWAALVAYGLAGQVLGWVIIARGLPRISASLAGLLLLLQPTLAFVWDILFFAKPVDTAQGLGAALALAGIYLGATARK